MKWRIKSVYYRSLYVLIVLAGLVAAAAADLKWR